MVELTDNYGLSFYSRGSYWNVYIFSWDSEILLNFCSHDKNAEHRLAMLKKHGFRGFAY